MPPKRKLPLLEALAAHRAGLRFHMPGHKGAGAFREFFGSAADFDVTELRYSDNLQHPTGAIAASERMTAAFFGAKYCLYSTGGSTLSVFCALSAAKRATGRNRILLSRDTHKSFFAACEVLDLEPVAVPAAEFRSFVSSVGRSAGPGTDAGAIRAENEGASCFADAGLPGGDFAAVVFTCPDYYGKMPSSPDFAFWRENGTKVILDCAHGAHLAETLRPLLAEADFSAVSAHKFLPSFGQSALLLANGEADAAAAAEARNLFGTTSPSYLLLAGIEFGVDFLAREGGARMAAIDGWKRELFSEFEIEESDALRLVWNTQNVCRTGFEVEELLNDAEIFPEFADECRVVFFLGLETRREDLEKLRDGMRKIAPGDNCSEASEGRPFSESRDIADGAQSMSYLEARRAERELVELSESVGRICAQNAGFYPPAHAFLLAGELIPADKAERLLGNSHVFGVEEGRVWAVKEKSVPGEGER